MPARRTVTGVFNWCEASAENLAERCSSTLVDWSSASARSRCARVLLGGDRQPFHRPGETARDDLARAQPAEEQQCSGNDHVPANLTLPRDRIGQRIKGDLIRRWIQRTGV